MSAKRDAKSESVAKPRLTRIALLKDVLQGYRAKLDEKLQPLGLTTAQIKMLWMVQECPEMSGAQVARMCSVTPQTGQATMAKMEAEGWLRRHPKPDNERVLVAELTAEGRRLLRLGRSAAEKLDREIWKDVPEASLQAMENALGMAVEKLGRW